MKDILKDDNPVLKEVSKEVSIPLSEEDEKTLLNMYQYVVSSQDKELAKKHGLRPSVGIAAPQIGILKRMCICRVTYGDGNEPFELALVNPKIVASSKKMQYLEGGEACLSVTKDFELETARHQWITVVAYDYFLKSNIKFKVSGFEAIVVQHELDHLDGIVFTDKLSKREELDAIKAVPL